MPVVQDTRIFSEDKTEEISEIEDCEYSFGYERRRRSIYDDEADEDKAMRYLAAHEDRRGSSRHFVNWVKLSIVGVIVLILLIAGGWVFLNRTDAGQRMLARMGRDANSVAYWAVGDELMDRGEIDKAIENFQKAKEKDEAEGVVDVDGLLTLASAYEAAGQTKEAADLYEEIYTQTPSRTEAYVNHIRILQNSDDEKDLVKAGELMKLAYDKTGDKTFLTQRSDLLPAPPEVQPIAGYYETKKTLVFSSYQGYDVYFTFDDEAELPYGGIKATREGYMLDEGIYNMRAVAVNGELVSDELKCTYKIIMPSPQTPRATLAPNTYKNSQQVRLKPGIDDENDTSIIIYYTVDGSTPDSDSPIYNGEPIQLPNGWVNLKAIAVNRYRKLSNMLDIKYKIEANPKPKAVFSEEDTIDKLKINQTTQNEFFNLYTQGESAGSVQQEGFETECRRYDYPWGYAVMNLSKKNWVLVEVSLNASGVMEGPRGTQIGDTEAFVIGKFRDMLQVESNSGNRGLYSTGSETGKIWLQENNEKVIRYRYAVDSHWVQLEYLLNSAGTVRNINLKYIP
jgi:tetratricopeptide (TPR) repeat protein